MGEREVLNAKYLRSAFSNEVNGIKTGRFYQGCFEALYFKIDVIRSDGRQVTEDMRGQGYRTVKITIDASGTPSGGRVPRFQRRRRGPWCTAAAEIQAAAEPKYDAMQPPNASTRETTPVAGPAALVRPMTETTATSEGRQGYVRPHPSPFPRRTDTASLATAATSTTSYSACSTART